MTLDGSLLILANIYIFYENDTNEVKGSYHDDCLEKKKKKKSKQKKKKKKNHILHIELGHGGKLLQKYEFCKMPSERNERGDNFSMFDNFFHFLRIFALGPFLLIRLS